MDEVRFLGGLLRLCGPARSGRPPVTREIGSSNLLGAATSLSSSSAKDVALSRRKQGFNSPQRRYADIAQPEERQLAKLEVAGSIPAVRSRDAFVAQLVEHRCEVPGALVRFQSKACDGSRSGRGAWLWSMLKRVQVPSVTSGTGVPGWAAPSDKRCAQVQLLAVPLGSASQVLGGPRRRPPSRRRVLGPRSTTDSAIAS